MSKKIVYTFCTDPGKDRVAPNVFDKCKFVHPLEPTDIVFDGLPVFQSRDSQGNVYLFAPTADVISHDYRRYLPELIRCFPDVDLVGIVNWHEGASAPNNIFCAIQQETYNRAPLEQLILL